MLVDTNVVSELMRPAPQARVVAWAARQARLHLSVISLEEILFALAVRPNERVQEWLSRLVAAHCDVLVVSASVAQRCSMLRAAFRKRGQQRTQADMLIAATAFEHSLALVTRNVKDFEGCAIPVLNPFEA